MKKKMYKKIFIFIVLAIGLFWVNPVFAQVDELVVEFETIPLFQEANFLPGEGVTRWVKVTNNSGQSQRIATEAINKNDPGRLGDVLELEIKEGGSRLYKDALSKFFTTGEIYLSDLANGTTTQYDFIVTFYSGAGNPFQGKRLGFDLLVGFQGEEGGLLPGAGGGVGGYLPPGLTITDEAAEEIGATEVTITWLTSYSSTSQVIYDTSSDKFDLTKPNYGYANSTTEDLNKVLLHTITISGLNSGTTYYYRCVSHGSLAVSTEHSFTTLGAKEGEEEVEPAFVPPGNETSAFAKASADKSAGKEEEKEIGELEKPELAEIGFEEQTGLGKFLAAIGAFPLNLKVILIILALILIGLFILWLIKKKKERK